MNRDNQMSVKNYGIWVCFLMVLVSIFTACEDTKSRQRRVTADSLSALQQQALADSLAKEKMQHDSLKLIQVTASIQEITDSYYEFKVDDFRKIGWYKSSLFLGRGIDCDDNNHCFTFDIRSVVRVDGDLYFGVFYSESGIRLVPERAAVMIGDSVIWSESIPSYDPRNSMKIDNDGTFGTIWFKDGADNGIFEAINDAGDVRIRFRLENETKFRDFELSPRQVAEVQAAFRLSELLKELERLLRTGSGNLGH